MALPLGQILSVSPHTLKPARTSLECTRLERQRHLQKQHIARLTPVQVNPEGVIVDGHHAVRAAAEDGSMIEVKVVTFPLRPVADSILDLPVE